MAATHAPSFRNPTIAGTAGAMLLLGLMAVFITYRIGGDNASNATVIVKGATMADAESTGITQSPAIATVLSNHPETSMPSGFDRAQAGRVSMHLRQEGQVFARIADARLGLARHDRVTPGGRYFVPLVEADATDP